MEVMGLGLISVGYMLQSSLLPLRSKVFPLGISRNVAPTSVRPPSPQLHLLPRGMSSSLRDVRRGFRVTDP